ncbi:MAG: hypothetical protein JSU70_14070, partial [Phycisphaerales bacterium]
MDGMSKDAGRTWARTTKLTRGGGRNHTHARRPVNAHPDFYALWADAHGSKTSESNLYFCDKKGNVWGLPREMKDRLASPLAAYSRNPDPNDNLV